MKSKDDLRLEAAMQELDFLFLKYNKTDNETAERLIAVMRNIKLVMEPRVIESVDPASKDFAEKHRPFLEKIGEQISSRGLFYYMMAGDEKYKNTIVMGHITPDQIAHSVVGLLKESDELAQKILWAVGVPQNFIDAFKATIAVVKNRRSANTN